MEPPEEPSRGVSRPVTDRPAIKSQDNLWNEILGLAALVDSALMLSITALRRDDPRLLSEVKTIEREINRREVAIECECFRVLALFEPLASDLRRVVTILRVNRELERIGDLAARIAKRAKKLARQPEPVPIPEHLEDLAEAAILSVRGALESFTSGDANSGRSVIADDDRLDDHRRSVRSELKRAIRNDAERLDQWLQLMDVARHLERVGDHATAIAKSAIYMKEGHGD